MIRQLPEATAVKLAGVAEVFAERGFDGTKIDDLAAATGVPKSTIFYYFTGKEDVLAWLLRRVLGQLHDAVQVVAARDEDAASRLVGVVRAQLEVMAAEPVACRVLLVELQRAGRIPDIALAIHEAFHEPVEDLLAEGARDGSLRRSKDASLVATAVFGAVTVVGLRQLVLEDRVDVAGSMAALRPLLLDGLGKKA